MKLKLENNKWYAWQMLPGYGSGKYYSPIKIIDIDRCKEVDIIVLHFYNACYAQGVRDFNLELKIIAHSKECMICEIEPKRSNYPTRMAIIEEIDYLWIRRYITKDRINREVDIFEYLDNYFR